MKLEPLMTYHADLTPPVEIGGGPLGNKLVFDVLGGSAKGLRLRGKFLASGGDWILVNAGGTGRLDVRVTLAVRGRVARRVEGSSRS